MIDPAAMKELIEKYSKMSPVSDEERSALEKVVEGADGIELEGGLTNEPAREADPKDDKAKRAEDEKIGADIRQQLMKMTLPQKFKLAMFGNSVCRRLLIGEANKLIQNGVLKNPQLQMREIEEFAKNPNLSDNVLRSIAMRQEWSKNYTIKQLLVLNPKAPLDITIKWLKFLNKTDVKRVARSKGLPQALVNAAQKRVQNMSNE